MFVLRTRRTSSYIARLLVASSALSALPGLMRADTILVSGPYPCTSTARSQGVPNAPYTERGFQIVSRGELASWCTPSPNFGGWGMFQTAGNIGQMLSAIDNSVFSVLSIDVANIFAGSAQSGSLIFIGHLFGGGVVTQTFN